MPFTLREDQIEIHDTILSVYSIFNKYRSMNNIMTCVYHYRNDIYAIIFQYKGYICYNF